MLEPIAGMPGIAGFRAKGTVLASDIHEAAESVSQADARGVVVLVDADFDGYFAELVRGLEDEAARPEPRFAHWALVVNDDAVDEARQYGGFTPDGAFRLFPASRRQDALNWAAS